MVLFLALQHLFPLPPSQQIPICSGNHPSPIQPTWPKEIDFHTHLQDSAQLLLAHHSRPILLANDWTWNLILNQSVHSILLETATGPGIGT